MNEKRRFLALLLMAASLHTAKAQMVVLHMAGNQTIEYNISQLDSITFDAHEWVDLGLPSGTLWATCNVGASSPEEYGDHYAWGETKQKEKYNWNTYKYCEGTYSTMTKYCTNSSYGNVDEKLELETADDAASVNWGEGWQTPSLTQLMELLNNNFTSPIWTQYNGVNGLLVTSKSNGNSIFLPAANYSSETSIYEEPNTYGLYWSRTLIKNQPNNACRMDFSSDYLTTSINGSRCSGLSVRPVRVKKQ